MEKADKIEFDMNWAPNMIEFAASEFSTSANVIGSHIVYRVIFDKEKMMEKPGSTANLILDCELTRCCATGKHQGRSV